MTTDQALAFVLSAVAAAITPGPSNLLLTSTGANAGVRRGLPCLFGVAVGMGMLMFVVAFGLGSLVLENPIVLQGLKWAGIGVLLRLAWKIATATPSDLASGHEVVGFWGAAAFQWVNPKSWLVSASAAGTYLQPEAATALIQALLCSLLFILATLPSCLVWLAFGASIQRFMRSTRVFRAVNIGMGLLLAASIFVIIR